ncbi:MAG: transglycosylase SLT domain-containing protein [Gallionella sp.]|nr:transglycosylase SLT domain-containing protein [Gallionella sp.]MDD4959042.1 transglycosylase SLT domain-containing protein [Gallionella sp.]
MKLLLLSLLLFVPAAWASQDADFLAANEAFQKGNASRLDQYAQKLKHSDLDIYVRYYQLRLKLETAEASEVKHFLTQNDDSPVIDRLRGEWLKVLGKQQKWTLFNSEYSRVVNSDAELTCYALQARYLNQPDQALREARALWFTGKDMPSSCTPLFESALSGGVISEDDAWQRLKLALESSNLSVARSITSRLSPQHAISTKELDASAQNPAHYLKQVSAEHPREGQRAVMLFALLRLAKQSPDLALTYWDAKKFTTEEQQYFYGWLGYEAVRKQDDLALRWFKRAGNHLNELQLAWRVRAALRVQNWGEVLNSVEMMNEIQQRESAWQYWKARALQAQGRSAEATRIFSNLSNEYNFYGQLASEELSKTTSIGNIPVSYLPDRQSVARVAELVGIQRATTLYRLALRTDALKEWAWAIRGFSDQELLAAAEYAKRNSMFDRAINAADKTISTHDFNLRYLAPYRSALHPHIQDNNLDEAWVYGLMRQESRFVTVAKSTVGAAGLMQIMPSTARWVARKMGLKNYRASMIDELDTNLKLGTYYMKNVLSTFDDDPVLASAAYNAGPGRARRWRGEMTLEGAIYAETIPFDETRDYVKKVMSNTSYYAIQFGAPWRSLKTRLGSIAAKTAANQQAIPNEK